MDGRNTCRVNGRIVPLRLLSTLAQQLVDIHGQNQHQSLLRVREHMDILDKYGGLWQLRTEVAEGVRQLTEVRQELDRLRKDEEELAQRVDFLRYQAGEISTANLRSAEDDDLALERDRVANAERIITLSDHAYRALYESFDRHESVMDLIGQVSKDLSQLERLDPSLRQTVESVEALTHQVEELAHTLRSYRDGIEYSPVRLQELEERLEFINSLKRKYGSTIEEILVFGERASQELEKLYYSEERVEGLKSRESRSSKAGRQACGSALRSSATGRQAPGCCHSGGGYRACLGTCPSTCGYPSVRLGGRCAGWDRGSGPARNTFFRWGVYQAPCVQRDRHRLRGILDLTEPGRTATAPSQNRVGGRSLQADARHKGHPIHG